ncbi:MAG: hypothetical protein F2743_08460 [Actinobacteria bacterium]|nr:hypothetical protein [Actinomycetota bacterium]
MAGRPPGAPNKDKPFRDALRMEIAEAGENLRALRAIARNLIAQAGKDETSALGAIKEVADRLDGRVAQPIAGADGEGAVQMEHIFRWMKQSENGES